MLKSLAYSDEEIAKHKEQSEKYCAMPGDYKGPKYPWGLELRLETSSLEKLGKAATDFKVGTEIPMNAIVRVTSVSSNETEDGGKSECVCLVVQQMDIEGSKTSEQQAAALYKEA